MVKISCNPHCIVWSLDPNDDSRLCIVCAHCFVIIRASMPFFGDLTPYVMQSWAVHLMACPTEAKSRDVARLRDFEASIGDRAF